MQTRTQGCSAVWGQNAQSPQEGGSWCSGPHFQKDCGGPSLPWLPSRAQHSSVQRGSSAGSQAWSLATLRDQDLSQRGQDVGGLWPVPRLCQPLLTGYRQCLPSLQPRLALPAVERS